MINNNGLHLPTPFPSSFCTSSSFPDKAAWCNFCNLLPLLAFWKEKYWESLKQTQKYLISKSEFLPVEKYSQSNVVMSAPIFLKLIKSPLSSLQVSAVKSFVLRNKRNWITSLCNHYACLNAFSKSWWPCDLRGTQN